MTVAGLPGGELVDDRESGDAINTAVSSRPTFRRAVPWVGLLMLLSACGTRFGAPEGATEEGASVNDLYRLMFYAAIGVAGVVYALIFWSVLRYRRRRGEGDDALPPQFRKNIPLEVVYTVVPILIVGWLFVETLNTERPIDDVDPTATTLRVNATGFQWQWRFEYPDHGISFTGTPGNEPEIWLPVGRRVEFLLRAPDVIHSFYIPKFLFKRDAIPGMDNRFDLLIEEEGIYRGECAEYCGLDHAYMNFTIRAVSPQEFELWLENGGRPRPDDQSSPEAA